MRRHRINDRNVSEWVAAWLGIAFSGTVSGAFTAARSTDIDSLAIGIGASVGFLVAGGVAFLVVPSIAILTWSLLLLRWNRVTAMIAGVVAGLLSAIPFHDPLATFSAALLGGLGAAIGVVVVAERKPAQELSSSAKESYLNFSVLDLTLRVGAIAMLLAVWVSLFRITTQFDTHGP